MQLNTPGTTMQLELLRLRSRLTDAGSEVDKIQLSELMAENERLVLAVLASERIAEKAVQDLKQLAWSSQRDHLTKTPNRVLMLERLESAITMAQRRGTRLAVSFLDIDKFKQINDVLRLVARSLESVIRESDTISRHGGDEFLVLLAELSQSTGAGLIAEKMIKEISAQSGLCEPALNLSVSIGIAVFPDHGTDATTLIRRADEAMYQCKRTGGGGYSFYGELTPE
jgi:diguanylate cyclase (GGDEF)-like protein